jgi:hypothetical protein
MSRVVARNLLAGVSTYIAVTLFLKLVEEPPSPFSLVPLIASLGSPTLGVAFATLLPVLVSYLNGKYAYALIFLPASLFILFKNVQNWRGALLILLSSLLAVLAPVTLPFVLGVLLSQVAGEDYRETVSSGLVFSLVLFVFSGVRAENTFVDYFLLLPGGIYSSVSSNNPISAASLFYLVLFEEIMKNPFLLASLLGLISGFIVASVSGKSGRLRGITLGSLVVFVPSFAYTLNYVSSVAGLLLMAGTGLGIALLGEFSIPRISFSTRRKKGEEKRPRPAVDIVFRDILAILRGAEAEGILRNISNVVVMGLCLKDEEYVAGLVRRMIGENVNVYLLHREDKERIVSLPKDQTIVVYISPFSPEEYISVLAQLTRFPPEVFETTTPSIRMTVPRMCRSQFVEVAYIMLSLVEKGYTARRAFETAMSSQRPSVGEEFFYLLEYLSSEYVVLGFRQR